MSEIIISDDYAKAYSLDKKIKAGTQTLQDTIFELGKNLMEMRDGKLYKEFGYPNFAEYCEKEVGIKRTQAHTYVTIAENLPEDFVQSTEQIGTQKLYLLAKVDELTRNQIVQNTDVSNTSVKELQKKIDELQDENSQTKKKINELENENNQTKKKLEEAEKENILLSGQIEELENRPHDVVVAAPVSKEVKNMELAMKKMGQDFEERYDQLQDDNEKYVRSLHKQHREEIEKIQTEHNAEIEEIRREYDGKSDTKESFKAYLSNSVDALNRLLDFIENHNNDNNLSFYLSKIDGVIDIIKARRNSLSGKE